MEAGGGVTASAARRPRNDNVVEFAPPPALDAAYRASVSIHFPNSDPLSLSLRVELMALRDRTALALRRCCPDAEPSLREALRLATVNALSNNDARTLGFTRVAIDNLIFAAQMLQRGSA